MRLGYRRGGAAGIDQLDHNAYYKIDRMYVDKAGENIALKELQAYCRRGDVIVVRDIRDLCETAGAFVELLCDLSVEGVSISCVSQRVDTSTFEWQAMLQFQGFTVNFGYDIIRNNKGGDCYGDSSPICLEHRFVRENRRCD